MRPLIVAASIMLAMPATAQTAAQKLYEDRVLACIAKRLPRPTRDTPGPSAGSISAAREACEEQLTRVRRK